jgi:hypothetical protein
LNNSGFTETLYEIQVDLLSGAFLLPIQSTIDGSEIALARIQASGILVQYFGFSPLSAPLGEVPQFRVCIRQFEVEDELPRVEVAGYAQDPEESVAYPEGAAGFGRSHSLRWRSPGAA